MFVSRCVLPLTLTAALTACDRSDGTTEEPPRRTLAHEEAFAAPDDTTTGGDADDEFVDDFVGPPYDGDGASYEDELSWEESDAEIEEESVGDYEDAADAWCDAAPDPVCDYAE